MSTYSGLDLETLGSWPIMSKILPRQFLKGIENKNTVKYPYVTGIKNSWNPHYRYPNGMKKLIPDEHWLTPHCCLSSDKKPCTIYQDPIEEVRPC